MLGEYFSHESANSRCAVETGALEHARGTEQQDMNHVEGLPSMLPW
jgi:hypothetical protein